MSSITKAVFHASLLTDLDIYLFKQGCDFRLYQKLGSHIITVDGVKGAYFAVWAPNASTVSPNSALANPTIISRGAIPKANLRVILPN
jgi:1,4-alpha-glucan branching enzyme